jgi:hypothetical protein
VPTVVKARYSRGAGGSDKGHVRYAVHRSDEQGQRQYRQVWGPDGARTKDDAYQLLDGADRSSFVYRITLSPDPREQDAGHRLDLQAWTSDVMRLAGSARWVAVSHEQSDHRHVHVVAVSPRRLDVRDFRAMRAAGDEHTRANTRELTRER